jgi:hypothetical protein
MEVTMSALLYKYRPIANWKFFKDIVVKSRLYAAPFPTLNDPMEGLLYLFDKEVSRRYRASVRNASARLRICSLCEKSDNTLLWSYYADAHKGVAIGVTVPDRISPRVDKPERVKYDMTVSIDTKSARGNRPGAIAKNILSQKLIFWNHELEHRVFTTQQYVPVKIGEILLGCRMSQENERKVRSLASRYAPDVEVIKMTRADLEWPGHQVS